MTNISRVSTLQTSNTMLGYLMSAESKYNELSQQASSGIKINDPSDDPNAVKKILKITSKLSELNGYSDNIANAQSELNTTSTTLSSVEDLISKASDYATQAANGTYNSEDLVSIKSQVDQIVQGVLDLSNTNYNGKYIFSGTATSNQTYEVTTDLATGNITGIRYNGTQTSDYERYTTISDGVSVATNVKGSAVFGSYSYTSSTADITGSEVFGTTITTSTDTDGNQVTVTTTLTNNGDGTYTTETATAAGLFGSLMTLSNALADNDTTTINSCISSLSTDLGTVTKSNTKLASVSGRLEMTSDSLDETITNLKSYKSDLQDADLTEVLTDLATQENALNATYSITSQLLTKTTLLDYI